MIKTTLCMSCTHLHRIARERTDPLTCDAFPDGIASDIAVTGEIRHDQPIKGDNGIQYEKREDW